MACGCQTQNTCGSNGFFIILILFILLAILFGATQAW